MKRYSLAILVLLTAFASPALAQENASDDRNVMLNAESGSAPREISFGLPTGGSPAIREDGMALAYGNSPATPYFHWAGGNSYDGRTLLSVPEATILAGDIGFVVDSFTRLGGDTPWGGVTLGTSSNGLIRVDAAWAGRVAKGWYLMTGAYLNLDPTSVNSPSRKYIEQKQIYRLGLTRRWKDASASLLYKFSICNDATDGYGYAPFIYNGDGTITPFEGFRLGRDNYFPADDAVSWIDVKDGTHRSGNLRDLDDRRMHDVMLMGYVRLPKNWRLDMQAHFSGSGHMNSAKMSLVGIDQVAGGKTSAGTQVTLADGTPYSGYVQNRLATISQATYADFMNQVVASKRTAGHYLRLGLNAWYDWQEEYGSTFFFAHSVGKDPVRLHFDGLPTWKLNLNSTFFYGFKEELTGFVIDEFTPNDRLRGRIGLRGKLYRYGVDCLVNPPGETFNTRTEGFHAKNGVAKLQKDLIYNKFDYALTGSLSYRLAGRLFLTGEGLYYEMNRGPGSFKSASFPIMEPAADLIARGGLMYDNSWMDITTMVSYVSALNSIRLMSVTKQINGVSETQTYQAHYGIGTVGITTEANVHHNGFLLHALLTLQNPRYLDYENTFTFSNGQTEEISYTGNFVSGISRMELELDPSYSWKNVWRFWASFRYFSRQYVSRTNNAYFNGHWETFCGVDRQIGSRCKFSLNVVNFLFQNGAKGSIDVADTITDKKMLEGLVMAGTYIRPFTLEANLTYTF
ncbi:MAG: hypothetical protein II874_11310 [Bacteroidales bacterium]|nr:hypothetical protein [Bacteroidales bacterium]